MMTCCGQKRRHGLEAFKAMLHWAVWRGATSLVEGVKPDWEHLFLSLRCPVMLVFGERSLPDDDFNRLQQNGVAVKIIPDAGHSMSRENPSALAQALSGFINGS